MNPVCAMLYSCGVFALNAGANYQEKKDTWQAGYLCTMLENETHRLRAMEPHDSKLLFSLENMPSEWWLGATMHPIGKEALVNFASGQHDIWRDLQLRLMVETRGADAKTVGAVDLYHLDPRNSRAGIGVVITENERRQGHAEAGIALLASYAFYHLGLHQLWAEVPGNHAASLGLFEACGFTKTGHMKDWIRKGDDWVDIHTMQLIRPDKVSLP